jgi:hypothetical protein
MRNDSEFPERQLLQKVELSGAAPLRLHRSCHAVHIRFNRQHCTRQAYTICNISFSKTCYTISFILNSLSRTYWNVCYLNEMLNRLISINTKHEIWSLTQMRPTVLLSLYIHCKENKFTEQLPSNGRLFSLHYFCFQASGRVHSSMIS